MPIKVKISSVTDGTNQKLYSGVGRAEEEFNNRSYFQHVGFSSIPKEGSVGIVFKEDNTFTMVASTDTSSDRPVLSNAGDVCIYSDADKYVKVAADGEITITNSAVSGGKIVIKANGDIEIGSASLASLMTDSIITKFNTHTHISAAPTVATSVPTPLFLTTDATSKTKAQ